MRDQMHDPISIDGDSLTLEDLAVVAKCQAKVSLSNRSLETMRRVRTFIEEIAHSHRPYYGINTGFGALAEKRISGDDINTLQRNLILSHSVGFGDPLSFEEARVLMLLRANTLAKGYSGVRPIIVENLLALLNHDCAPFVPRKGSVGASGDLAPLA